MQHTAWKDFNTGVWDKAVDVRDFIQRNYIPYEGDDSFLAGPTERTTKLWEQVMKLYEEEREKNDYQFRLIQEQIKPHFLYNTLEMIKSMIDLGIYDEAGEAISTLASS